MPITHTIAQKIIHEARCQFAAGPKSWQKTYPRSHAKHAKRAAGARAAQVAIPRLHSAARSLAPEEYGRQLRHARVSFGEASEMTLTTAALLREHLPRSAVRSAWYCTVHTGELGGERISNSFLSVCDATSNKPAAFLPSSTTPVKPAQFFRDIDTARGIWLLDPFFNVATNPPHYEAQLQSKAGRWGVHGKQIVHMGARRSEALVTLPASAFVNKLFGSSATMRSARLDLDRLWTPFAPIARAGLCIAVVMPDVWATMYRAEEPVTPDESDIDAMRRGLRSIQTLGLPTLLVGRVPDGVRPQGVNVFQDPGRSFQNIQALITNLLLPPTEWLIVIPWQNVEARSVIDRLVGAAEDCGDVLAPMTKDGAWEPLFARYRGRGGRAPVGAPAPLVLSLEERSDLFGEQP